MTMATTETLLRTEGLWRVEMKEPDDVSVMLRLKALGWGARRIAAELGVLADDRPAVVTARRVAAGGVSGPRDLA